MPIRTFGFVSRELCTFINVHTESLRMSMLIGWPQSAPATIVLNFRILFPCLKVPISFIYKAFFFS